jgi:MFS family permease
VFEKALLGSPIGMEAHEPHGPAAEPQHRKGAILTLITRNRDFRLLFVAMIISFAGDWFLFVALAGLIFELTGSPGLVAALFAAMTVPFALFTFVGGPLADRLNRQWLMVTADVVRGLLALGFLLIDRPSQVWLVFLLTGAISALQAVFTPSATAAIPNLVDREDLPAANVLAAASWGTMLTVGSSLGGIVVAAFGRDVGYVADAASFLISAGLVMRIRRPFSEPREVHEEHPGLIEASREAFRYARRDHRVLALLTVKGGFGLGAGAIALVPILALAVFDAGDRGTGILYGFRGIGIVLGPFLVRPFISDDLRTVFWAIAGAFGVFALSYAFVPWMPYLFLAGLFVLAGHLGGGVQWTLSSYALQIIVPDRIRGRIFAFDEALVSVTIAVSATLAGWAAEFVDVRVVMLALSGVAGLYAIVWTVATRRVRRSLRPETEPRAASQEPGAAPTEPQEPRVPG